MVTTYPGTLDNFTNPGPSDYEDVVSHSGQHSNANDAIEAIETVLGTTAGTAVLSEMSGAQKALNYLGTASAGDLAYFNGTAWVSVVAGTANSGKYLTTNGTAPSWSEVQAGAASSILTNSNFDVWQRGTTVAMTTANAYTADRWYAETATAETDKTVSQQDGTGVNGSRYCARVAMVQDVDELLTFSQALESQDSIKYRGQKVTLSFYARGGAEFVSDNATLVSKIVTGKGTDQKVLAFTTSADAVSQNNTLTTSWQKFTCTTTSAIASDITQIGISFSFTHAGSGVTTNYFEVTQVQLCAGDVDLEYIPLSFSQELTACQRYFEKSYSYTVAPGTSVTENTGSGIQFTHPSANGGFTVNYKATKRTASPTISTYDRTGAINKITGFTSAWVDGQNYTFKVGNDNDLYLLNLTASTINTYFNWTVDAEF